MTLQMPEKDREMCDWCINASIAYAIQDEDDSRTSEGLVSQTTPHLCEADKWSRFCECVCRDDIK